MDRDVSRLDKFHLKIERETGAWAAPIRRLYELSWGEACSVREISPASRFALVMNSIYRPILAPIFSDVSMVRRVAVTLSQGIRAFVLERPRRLEELEAVSAAIAEHCGQV